MTEGEALQLLREHFESLFPKMCPACHRVFTTLREYIETTTRIGPARSFDAELGEWTTTAPIGSLALANCPCGSTLAIGTEGMLLSQRLALLGWVQDETQRRGVDSSQLLEALRDEIRRQVLDGPAP